MHKLRKYALGKWIARGIELPGSAGCDKQHKVQTEASDYWCTPGLQYCLNMVINDLVNGAECTLIESVYDTKL